MVRQVYLLRDKDHTDRTQARIDCLRRKVDRGELNVPPGSIFFEEWYTSDWGVPLENLHLYVLQMVLMDVADSAGVALWKNGATETWRAAAYKAMDLLPRGGRPLREVLRRDGSRAFLRAWWHAPHTQAVVKALAVPADEVARMTDLLERLSLAKPTSKSLSRLADTAMHCCARLRDYAFLDRLKAVDRRVGNEVPFVAVLGEGHIGHLTRLLQDELQGSFRVRSGKPARCRS